MTYRFVFEKRGTACYISHLELGKVIERSFRRAKVVVEYSEGFNPHMKLSFGPALALGCESYGEYIDIRLPDAVVTDDLLARINVCTPQGVRFVDFVQLPESHSSLGNVYNLASYEATLSLTPSDLEQFSNFLNSEQCIYEKVSPKGRKIVDVKKLLVEPPALNWLSNEDYKLSYAVLLNLTGGTIKPAEFVTAIFGKSIAQKAQYCRVKLSTWSLNEQSVTK
ncbi:MAG: TIGR03936 family radical SAM-associated protein [Negativicutes bacterium]|jgi:radical SAM-linked protein